MQRRGRARGGQAAAAAASAVQRQELPTAARGVQQVDVEPGAQGARQPCLREHRLAQLLPPRGGHPAVAAATVLHKPGSVRRRHGATVVDHPEAHGHAGGTRHQRGAEAERATQRVRHLRRAGWRCRLGRKRGATSPGGRHSDGGRPRWCRSRHFIGPDWSSRTNRGRRRGGGQIVCAESHPISPICFRQELRDASKAPTVP
mmetsp:Transcript_1772/g.4365  ORF Transcript_1772/g.4365 Transcript_1772/m.4365 type:complete len:202 (-) Transcript_1772:59-664(-)